MELIIGIAVIAAAYGMTWFLLLKSMRVVNRIDKAGLKHPREIRQSLRKGPRT